MFNHFLVIMTLLVLTWTLKWPVRPSNLTWTAELTRLFEGTP